MVAENELLGLNGGAAGDDFFVDELLDFSNGFTETEGLEEPEEMVTETAKTGPVFSQEAPPAAENNSLSGKEDFVPPHESDLILQAEGLESLEWLSHFVEDSFCDYSLAGKFPPGAAENKPEMAAPVKEQPCFATPVQTKARTKRARAGVRVWPVQRRNRIQGPNLSPSFADSSTSSSSSTTSFPPTYMGHSGGSSLKKQKTKPADGGGAAQQRRCSHCGVTKTPQWRAGPHGPKTLCNACGVRFKSGRLLPEYRPACSPTFSSEIHSNNHRKVLEMRRKKELEVGAASPHPVQSF